MGAEFRMVGEPDQVGVGGDTRTDGPWWRLGTVIGVLGLVGFVVLLTTLLIGVFSTDSGTRELAVGLFPWALACLGVGIAGMVLAGSRTSSVDTDAGAEPGGDPDAASASARPDADGTSGEE